jgi:hypothetical protein
VTPITALQRIVAELRSTEEEDCRLSP